MHCRGQPPQHISLIAHRRHSLQAKAAFGFLQQLRDSNRGECSFDSGSDLLLPRVQNSNRHEFQCGDEADLRRQHLPSRKGLHFHQVHQSLQDHFQHPLLLRVHSQHEQHLRQRVFFLLVAQLLLLRHLSRLYFHWQLRSQR